MKKILTASLLLTLLTLISALAAVGDPVPRGEAPGESDAPELASDSKRSIRLKDGDEILTLTAEEYLVGVLSAEMPAGFAPEALKAQAVAARSYLQRCIESGKHSDADICSSPDCCQAYLSEKELKKSWGDNYGRYVGIIKNAVNTTDGEYLSYKGKAALAAFHSSSAGMTEDSGAVWNGLPYLVSVSSPESEDTVPNYVTKVTVTELDFRDTVLYLKPEANMTGEPSKWIGKVTRNDSGRVETAVIGGVDFSGTELRSLFSLRSTAFTIGHSDGKFTFTVTGFGHGVGMSQYGANAMAKSGSDYAEILSHYYPGTELVHKKVT